MSHVPFTDQRVDVLAKQMIAAKIYVGNKVCPWERMPDWQRQSFRMQAAHILYAQDAAKPKPTPIETHARTIVLAQPITTLQQEAVVAVAKDRNLTSSWVEVESYRLYQKPVGELTRKEASDLLDRLQRLPATAKAS